MPKQTRQLTHRQKLWAEHYAQNGQNATKAARDAGYSETGLTRITDELTKNYEVQKYVKTLTADSDQARAGMIASIAEVQALWSRAALSGVMPASGPEASEGEIQVLSARDRLTAAEHLVKSQGGFLDPAKSSGISMEQLSDLISRQQVELVRCVHEAIPAEYRQHLLALVHEAWGMLEIGDGKTVDAKRVG